MMLSLKIYWIIFIFPLSDDAFPFLRGGAVVDARTKCLLLGLDILVIVGQQLKALVGHENGCRAKQRCAEPGVRHTPREHRRTPLGKPPTCQPHKYCQLGPHEKNFNAASLTDSPQV
nr:hypothetical protein [Desulfobulbaceae bacterium]